jgi:hypothetical protein
MLVPRLLETTMLGAQLDVSKQLMLREKPGPTVEKSEKKRTVSGPIVEVTVGMMPMPGLPDQSKVPPVPTPS